MPLEPGLRGAAEVVVTDADTAVAMGSGSVPVLGTPRVVALCEEASVAATDGHLEAGTTTVGMRVQLDHLQPSAVGARVVAEATLERVDGRRLVFTVHANDHRGLIAAGRVTRVIVDTTRFMDKANN